MSKNLTAIFLIITGLSLLAYVYASGLGLSFLNTTLNTIVLVLLSSLYLFYRSNLNLGYILMVTTIPLSSCKVLIGLINVLTTFGGERGLYKLSEVLMILTAGAVLSSIGYFCSPKNLDVLKVKLLNSYDILIVLLMFSIWLFLEASENTSGLGAFAHPLSLSIILAFIAFSSAGGLLMDKKFSASLTDGSVAAVLFGIVICAAFYFTSLQDLKAVGPVLALGLVTCLYGCILYYFSFLYSLRQGTVKQLKFTTKNWHIIEGLGFLIFLVFGPPTLWETFVS